MDMLFSQWAGRYGRYLAISTVLVKIWSNNGTIDWIIPTRPARLSQVYMFSPIHTSKGWCKPNMLLAQWAGSSGHYMGISTVLVKIQSKNGTRGWSIPTMTSMPLLGYMFLPIHSSKGWCKPNMLLAQWAGSSGHYMGISTVLVKIWSNTGTKGCRIPTKTSMPLPNLTFLPDAYFTMWLYWSNKLIQVLRAMAVKRTACGRSKFGELMTVKIS
jgi:hypothetical protein